MSTAFETEMGVMPEIANAVKDLDWILPTDIQSESVPLILGGGDVLMAAETGSGKTGAFCLPLVQLVHETIKDVQNIKKGNKKPTSQDYQFRMNFYDRTDAFAIDSDGLLCQSRDISKWHGARCSVGVRNKGKYYYEACITDEGLCRVGWSTLEASFDIGTDNKSFGYGGTGKKSHCRQFTDYGESFGLHDTLSCLVDLDSLKIEYSKNGKSLGEAFKIPREMVTNGLFPSVSLKNAEILFNFGEKPFKYKQPSGYFSLAGAPKENLVKSPRGSDGKEEDFQLQNNAPLALILEPSRELAEQTFDQLNQFSKYVTDPPIRSALFIGGVNPREQSSALSKGVDIAVGTPGRVEDLINSKSLLLKNCRIFVLDECDGLLTGGYEQLITRLYNLMPKVTHDNKRLQMVVCSATLHSFEVKKMAKKLMHFPMWIDLKGQDSVPDTVHHVICKVDPQSDLSWKGLLTSDSAIKTDQVHQDDRIDGHSKPTPETLSEAVKLLKGEYVIRAIKEQNIDKGLIFCRTKVDCDNLEKRFIQLGGGPNKPKTQFSCVCMHSDRGTGERKNNLQMFKNDEVRFLICTDVAARGIDIKGLPYVINMTLPDEKQNYVHRIGRVGRAERMGLAISFISTVKEKVWYHSNCSTRGKGCYDTRLTTQGGCCVWLNEGQLLGDIEEHLGVTIDQIEANSMKVQASEFDGKVTYGQKKTNAGSNYKSHQAEIESRIKELNKVEKRVQQSYLNLRYFNSIA